MDGSILVSDEMNSLIYRITYVGGAGSAPQALPSSDKRENQAKVPWLLLVPFVVALMAATAVGVVILCRKREKVGVVDSTSRKDGDDASESLLGMSKDKLNAVAATDVCA